MPDPHTYACKNGHKATESTAMLKPWCGCGHRYLLIRDA